MFRANVDKINYQVTDYCSSYKNCIVLVMSFSRGSSKPTERGGRPECDDRRFCITQPQLRHVEGRSTNSLCRCKIVGETVSHPLFQLNDFYACHNHRASRWRWP